MSFLVTRFSTDAAQNAYAKPKPTVSVLHVTEVKCVSGEGDIASPGS